MNGDERRKKIINILSSSKSPVAGVALAKELDVSRQVIVQDIALLRANGAAIFSTNRGYLIQADKQYSRVLKVVHEDDEVEEELSTIVDAGGHGCSTGRNYRRYILWKPCFLCSSPCGNGYHET